MLFGGVYYLGGYGISAFADVCVRLLRMCVSQVLMELEQHLVLLWPTPPAVFPM